MILLCSLVAVKSQEAHNPPACALLLYEFNHLSARHPAILRTLHVLAMFDFLPDTEAIHEVVEVLAPLFGLKSGTFG